MRGKRRKKGERRDMGRGRGLGRVFRGGGKRWWGLERGEV